MDTLTKDLEELRQWNTKGLFEIIDMKEDRLTYQEARIEALEKEIEKLNIEIINLQIQLQNAENNADR
jgi:TolA-binding protein